MKPLTKKQLKRLAECLGEYHSIEVNCFVSSKKGSVEYGVAHCNSCGVEVDRRPTTRRWRSG